MLKAISDYAKTADFGIEEMQFEVENKEIESDFEFPENIPVEIKAALTSFVQILSETSNNSESQLKMSQIKARAKHKGINANGDSELYHLELEDESDGTRKLMSIAPAIESVLDKGGVLLVDELERELHPMLDYFIIAKFQSKDQIYFADKKRTDGSSELYSVTDFTTKTADNIRKGYLAGKYGATPNLEIEEVE